LTALHTGARGARPGLLGLRGRAARPLRGVLPRVAPDPHRRGGRGGEAGARGDGPYGPGAHGPGRAGAGEILPDRQLPAAPRHLRQARPLPRRGGGVRPRARLPGALQGAHRTCDRRGGPAGGPEVPRSRDLQLGDGGEVAWARRPLTITNSPPPAVRGAVARPEVVRVVGAVGPAAP